MKTGKSKFGGGAGKSAVLGPKGGGGTFNKDSGFSGGSSERPSSRDDKSRPPSPSSSRWSRVDGGSEAAPPSPDHTRSPSPFPSPSPSSSSSSSTPHGQIDETSSATWRKFVAANVAENEVSKKKKKVVCRRRRRKGRQKKAVIGDSSQVDGNGEQDSQVRHDGKVGHISPDANRMGAHQGEADGDGNDDDDHDDDDKDDDGGGGGGDNLSAETTIGKRRVERPQEMRKTCRTDSGWKGRPGEASLTLLMSTLNDEKRRGVRNLGHSDNDSHNEHRRLGVRRDLPEVSMRKVQALTMPRGVPNVERISKAAQQAHVMEVAGGGVRRGRGNPGDAAQVKDEAHPTAVSSKSIIQVGSKGTAAGSTTTTTETSESRTQGRPQRMRDERAERASKQKRKRRKRGIGGREQVRAEGDEGGDEDHHHSRRGQNEAEGASGKSQDQAPADGARHTLAKSYILRKEATKSTSQRDGETVKRVVKTRANDKDSEAFKFSMLKASLDYEARRTASMSSGTPSTLKSTWSRGKTRRAAVVGNNCSGPGCLRSYIDYVQNDGFVPEPVLHPEKGVEYGLFANEAVKNNCDSGDPSGTTSRISSIAAGAAGNLVPAHEDITAQFESIMARAEEAVKQSRRSRQESNLFHKRLSTQFEDDLEVLESLDFEEADTKKKRTSGRDKAVPEKRGTRKEIEISGLRKFDKEGPQDLDLNQRRSSLVSSSSSSSSLSLSSGKFAVGGAATGRDSELALSEEPLERPTPNALSGLATLDLFLDRDKGHASERHPALQEVLKKLDVSKQERAEKMRLQEDLFRLRSMRREGELRREHLVNKAKVLQNRANKHKAKSEEERQKLAAMWEEKFREELEKTSPLEDVCAALRDELDAAHRQRIEAFEIKMKPIIIKDGPSRKANFKIQAARLHYDIYALTQRLRHTTMRTEHEEQRRDRREREVRRLREEISEKKTAITTATKGIPFNKIEVRPDDQIPQSSLSVTQSNAPNHPTMFSTSSPHGFMLPNNLSRLSRADVMATPSVAAGALSATGNFLNGKFSLPTLPSIVNGPTGLMKNDSMITANPTHMANGRVHGIGGGGGPRDGGRDNHGS